MSLQYILITQVTSFFFDIMKWKFAFAFSVSASESQEQSETSMYNPWGLQMFPGQRDGKVINVEEHNKSQSAHQQIPQQTTSEVIPTH